MLSSANYNYIYIYIQNDDKHQQPYDNFPMVRVMVFNTTFNSISAISWRSVILVEETGEVGENHRHFASH